MAGSNVTSTVRRACIVVGGGDAPGVNAILRGFAHAARRRDIELLGCRDGFEGLVAPDGIAPIGLEHVRGVLARGGCVLGCSTRVNPFFVEPAAGGPPRDMGPAIVDRLRGLGVDALVLVGGDGTMVAARRFSGLGLPCIGVPKTIDNDLGPTEITCGFQTAVETATHAIDALHATAEAHARAMVVEVMGRHAGWIALYAGMAGGADVVLLPEIPYAIERVAAKIRERERLGRRFTIIVVSEGAQPIGGRIAEVEPARPGHLARLGGAGQRLADALSAMKLGHEVRVTVLGHLQRGGSPSPFDRVLGTRLGAYAADMCARGELGRMVAVQNGRVHAVPLEEACHRLVPVEGALVSAARDVGIELGA